MRRGAIIADEQVAPSLRPGMHASTFGGNPLAMAAGIATVETIEEEGLLENCQTMSGRFRERFEALAAELPIVEELRVHGLMIGLDYFILPGGVLGIEIGLACLFLALLFVVAFRIARRVEQMENKAGSHGPSVGPE